MKDPIAWRDHAACLNENPDLFFPVGTLGPAVGQTEEAKRVCADCPVRQDCLTWALAAGVDHGIWGGQSESELRSLRRARRGRPTPRRSLDPTST